MVWQSENPLLEYIEYGLTPAEAVDYYATEIEDFTQEEWAELRGLEGHQSVGRNVRVAREKIGDPFDSGMGEPFESDDESETISNSDQ